jgi:4-hydroxybenzoyl-CoA reductase subunit alpha
VEAADSQGPYGAKEAGEGPLHPIIPAISNAIFDAVGVRMNATPFSPARVLAAIEARKALEASGAMQPHKAADPPLRQVGLDAP